MKNHRLVEWHFILILAFVPIVIIGFVLAAGLTMGAVQYEPSYFTQDYTIRYQSTRSLLEALEQAVRNGDASKIAELQAVRWAPLKVKPLPSLQFSTFWSNDEKYQNYLFFDASNNHRLIYHVKYVNGRYVWASENLYYYVDSGRWVRTFYPILAIWWIVLFLYFVARRVYFALIGFKPEKSFHRLDK